MPLSLPLWLPRWFDWSFWATGVLDSLHFACALIALLLGPVIMLRPKGTAAHRWAGRVWALSMIVLNVSALSMYDLSGRPNIFHGFAVVSLVTLGFALWGIRQYARTNEPRSLRLHQHCMVWAYFGLFMAGIWQSAFHLARHGQLDIGFGTLSNLLGSFTAVAIGATIFVLGRVYPGQAREDAARA